MNEKPRLEGQKKEQGIQVLTVASDAFSALDRGQGAEPRGEVRERKGGAEI